MFSRNNKIQSRHQEVILRVVPVVLRNSEDLKDFAFKEKTIYKEGPYGTLILI